MVDQTNKEEINNVVTGDFALLKSPVSFQITVHVNNLLNTYGNNIIGSFKECLYNPENVVGQVIITGLINHYGVEAFKEWFTLIYGWDFTKKAG